MTFGTCLLQAKIVTRAAAKLAPSPVLTSIAAFQQASIATANSSNTAATSAATANAQQLQQQLQQGHMALEAAVILLESVLPSMCDPAVMSKEGQGLKDGLAALLQQLMALRFNDPLLVTLVRKQSTEVIYFVCDSIADGGMHDANTFCPCCSYLCASTAVSLCF